MPLSCGAGEDSGESAYVHATPSFPTVCASLLSGSVSLFLPCKQVHQIRVLCFFFFPVSFPHFLAVSSPSKQLACEDSSCGVLWVILAKLEAQAECRLQTGCGGQGWVQSLLQVLSLQDLPLLDSENSSFSWWDRMGVTSSRQLLLSTTYENPLLLFSMEKLVWVY